MVIDTTNIPKLDQAFRAIIARELGRNDFKYLINTHGHADHINGNGVYADCQIIAHENVKAMMEENFRNHPPALNWNKESSQEQKEQLASGKVKEEEKAAAGEQMIINTLVGEYLNSSPKPTFPTKTFKDKLVLDCGDVTLELYQSGGTHTQSDIFILVPQKGLLFTGDMMADKWLSDIAGMPGLVRLPFRPGRRLPGSGEELAGADRAQGRDQAVHPRPLERRTVLRGIQGPLRIRQGHAGRGRSHGQGRRRPRPVPGRLYPERQIPPPGRQPGLERTRGTRCPSSISTRPSPGRYG